MTLYKETPGAWSALVVGDTRGELVLDDAQRQRVQQQLEHLTSSTWVCINVYRTNLILRVFFYLL